MSKYTKFDQINTTRNYVVHTTNKNSKNPFLFTFSKIILATLLLTAVTFVLYPIPAFAETTSYNYVFEVCSFNTTIKSPKVEVTSDSEKKVVRLDNKLSPNTCKTTSTSIKAISQTTIKATLLNNGGISGKINTIQLNPIDTKTTSTTTTTVTATATTSNVKTAGWRSSEYGNDNPYGHDQTDPAYWISVAQKMSAKFPGSTPGGVLVVGEIDGAPGTATSTFMPFPKPAGTYPNVTFGTTDAIEPLLTAYDNAGLKVYLQVESADADMNMLMDLVMNRYKQHPSVIGFGIDVEWYHQKQYPDGRPLTDNEVNAWATKVQTYNPSYRLMLKHWDVTYLSNARPANVMFMTDTQQLGSLSAAISEYTAWVDHFAPAQVGFQIGYPADSAWWGTLTDPVSSMINPIISARPNVDIGAVYWVDFSVLKIFPANDVTAPTTTATPSGGTYSSTQSVKLTANEPSTIYYTIDGTTPTLSSTVYAAPISISKTSTLQFFAKDTSGNTELVKSQGYTISVSTTTPSITINDVTLTEGNSGTKNFVFTVTRSANAAAASVQYKTTDSSAISPSDYTAIPLGTINFAAGGSLTQTVTVPVVGDTSVEPNETFSVNLSNCVGCTITDNQGLGTITNDDSSTPSITVNDVTLTEGNSGTKNFVFTVKRSTNTATTTVNYFTADKTALTPTDYSARPTTTLTFAAGGSLTQTVTVPVVGDISVEPNETFSVNLSNCVGCTITDNQGLGTITNDDSSTPSITVNDVTLTEGNSGTKNFVFTVTRSANTAAASVQYKTTDSSAISPSDYTAIPLGTINFAAGGSLTQTVTVPVVGDISVEPNETFSVNLSNCVGCTITDNQGLGTITNDDSSTGHVKIAGWRSSEYGNDNPYGHDQTDPAYWISVAQKMSAKFPGSTPGGVLVVGEIDGAPGTATSTFMPFPKPAGTYPNVTFGTTDAIEPLLTAYDNAGLKVYLQVESADADMNMLMDLVMNRYKQHPSVIGFGIDVEWYHQKQYPDGRPLTDNEVNTWAMKVATYNPNYNLMVKHWDATYLSNARPANVLFLTDSEQIGSLSAAISEYTAWVDHFGTSQVGFQIGYPSDMSWWSKLSDPASSMINPVITARPNANIGAVYWVDFSVLKAFP